MANYDDHPSDYDPKYCAMLIDHMSTGLSYETFSAKIGTCRATLYRWEKMFPEWLDTKKKAMEISQLWWESAGVNGLYTIVEHGEGGQNIIEKKINPTMWIFNMKARFRWRDRDEEPKQLEAPEEKEILTIEDKKRLYLQAQKELEKLKTEIESDRGDEAKELVDRGGKLEAPSVRPSD